MTPTLSVAARFIVTIGELEVAGMLNAVMVGGVVSAVGGGVVVEFRMVTVALLLAEILPAASLTHA